MKYYNITVNGVAYSVSVEETAAGAAPVAAAAPAAPAAPKAAPAPAAAPKAAAGAAGAVAVKAPMPGNILDVKVKAGASVKAGDVLASLLHDVATNSSITISDKILFLYISFILFN